MVVGPTETKQKRRPYGDGVVSWPVSSLCRDKERIVLQSTVGFGVLNPADGGIVR